MTEESEAIDFILPMPPSANRMWRHGRGRTYMAPAYVNWRQEADWEVRMRMTGLGPFDEPVSIEIRARKPHARRDMDNTIKPVCDALQGGRAVTDDNLVSRALLEWDASKPKGKVFVRVEPLRGRVVA